MRMRYCPECGGALVPRTVAGQPRNHQFCPACGEPRCESPMVVVTCFVASGKRLLWIRRALAPKAGLWAIPGGYLEGGETLAEGAARELREETGVVIPPQRLQLYMTGTLTFINQIYVGFRATVDSDFTLPGVESLDCAFFSRDECPWQEVAYPEVNNAVEQAYRDLDAGRFSVWHAEMTGKHYSLVPVDTR
ncbi:NUDIX domain-containing protein [Parahaliea mediterranea]|uniref:NUDIX domain-containing protein n=1 Tax=Parahaliea mediterranea TaxID=651086 RepID=UPI00240DCEB5|nr:NUDIX domain-containing protein [Parahaliea mediterranea]